MKLKTIVIELSIPAAIFLVVLITLTLLTGGFFSGAVFDLNLSDTYIVFQFSWLNFIILPFLLLTVLVYIIRTAINGFKKRLQNLLLIISDFLFIALLLKLYAFANNVGQGLGMGSANQGSDSSLQPAVSHPANQLSQILLITLIIAVVIFIISAILTGKNWNKNKS